MEYIVMEKAACDARELFHYKYYCWDWKTLSDTKTSDSQPSLNRKEKRSWHKIIHRAEIDFPEKQRCKNWKK